MWDRSLSCLQADGWIDLLKRFQMNVEEASDTLAVYIAKQDAAKEKDGDSAKAQAKWSKKVMAKLKELSQPLPGYPAVAVDVHFRAMMASVPFPYGKAIPAVETHGQVIKDCQVLANSKGGAPGQWALLGAIEKYLCLERPAAADKERATTVFPLVLNVRRTLTGGK